ncbi:MAG: twin-arginine translocation signal domain-containing protein, partial [Alphaproteobacteria bacterium]|nr:twin-arginine translocation signal domain-containing protein [Alphaproteobacteria bacterium]
MTKTHQTNRRCFLKTSALAVVAAPTIIPSSALGQAGKPAPSNRITVGLIGCGGRGVGVMNSFLNESSAQVIA